MIQLTKHRAGKVAGAGVYLMPPEVYHQDPAPEPSLSSSLAQIICEESVRHAWIEHPRLNPGFERKAASRKSEIGERVHDLVCGRGRGHVRIEADDWRTQAAKNKRSEALKAGKSAILAGDMPACAQMLKAIRYRMRAHPTTRGFFREGNGEVVVIWKEHGVWFRSMIDWWGPTVDTIVDLKTTTAGLSDRKIAQRYDDGLDVQAAFQERAVLSVMPELGGKLQHRHVFVEQDAPHEIRTIAIPGVYLDQGRDKLQHAAKEWTKAMRSAAFAGYPAGVDGIQVPDWAGRRWQERMTQLIVSAPGVAHKDKRMQDLHRRLQRSAGLDPDANVNVLG